MAGLRPLELSPKRSNSTQGAGLRLLELSRNKAGGCIHRRAEVARIKPKRSWHGGCIPRRAEAAFMAGLRPLVAGIVPKKEKRNARCWAEAARIEPK
jgi:hypothetical protein